MKTNRNCDVFMSSFIFIFKLLIVSTILMTNNGDNQSGGKKFEIDYTNNTFVKDGKPFQYISGSFHYTRVPPVYWKDRLLKMRAAGLNAVQGYVPWNAHETKSGIFNWEGYSDLPKFLSLSQDSDLVVLLRLGPYICGEWEFGGFPAWILSENSNLVLRTSDPAYLKLVDRWFTILLKKIKPFLYENGGPIVMVQIENEYGSYFACDRPYGKKLRDKVRSILGNEVVIYTTDGCGLNYVYCGKVQDVYASVDFGPDQDLVGCFNAQRFYEPAGPLINSEFYTGWLDHWGSPHSVKNTTPITKALDTMLSMGANVNLYMFVGGTNYGFWNGANYKPYQSVPTSYDYDAPITEGGDISFKYFAIRDIISKYLPLPPISVPQNTTKAKYGKVPLKFVSTVQDALHILTPEGPFKSKFPVPMEKLNFYHGYILYRTILKDDYKEPVTLQINGVRDRAMVMINQVPVGIVDRVGSLSVSMTGTKGQSLDILVENQGRIGFAFGMNFNSKGIISNVTIESKTLTDWQIFPLHVENINSTFLSRINDGHSDYKPKYPKDIKISTPSIYAGSFQITTTSQVQDTFLDPRPFSKGQVFINDFNLGRYWPVRGPQVTLYVPQTTLRKSQNQVFFLELEFAPVVGNVLFTDTPYLNAQPHPDRTMLYQKDLKYREH